MKRINQTNSNEKSSADECVRDERSIPEIASSLVHKKENRRREAIGFEIPVTRGAFDQAEGSTDDILYHITKKTLAVKSCETRVTMHKCQKVGERKQLN